MFEPGRPVGRPLGRRLAIPLVLVATVGGGLCGCGSAAVNPSGTYTSDVASSALQGTLSGTWRLKLHSGVYMLTFTGSTVKNVIITGPYSVADGILTFHAKSSACSSQAPSGGCVALMDCRGPGSYRFTVGDGVLSFVKVRDPTCLSRTIVLSGRFRKIG
jgi:hypothetical protein